MAFQRFVKAKKDCFNKHNLNYMYEVSPHQSAWTLESGFCWLDKGFDDPRYSPQNLINASNLTDDEKCQYLLRCALSRGFEHDCPCKHRNCTQMMISSCSHPNRRVIYPPEGLINLNVFIIYNYSHSMENPTFQFFLLSGGLKCRGYFFQTNKTIQLRIEFRLIANSLVSLILCTFDNPTYGDRDFLSSLQNDKFCQHGSLTFNGRPYAINPDIRTDAGECISQYRIRDEIFDCTNGDDENMVLEKNYCTGNVARQRFQCFNGEHKCVTLRVLGVGVDMRVKKQINTHTHIHTLKEFKLAWFDLPEIFFGEWLRPHQCLLKVSEPQLSI